MKNFFYLVKINTLPRLKIKMEMLLTVLTRAKI